ncbi:alpha-ketoglutarate-dependent dioxygenase AlkB family protein [Massilia sp. GCM10020059]|uniref:Alpha-ketoglutarate-dependent dioxygenase AlkB n=1 Tax=Massilia agrisoli TaxID=2892444 RepID=A0ABS8IQW6_9BURK|nr:alpha-ketoglutarate-dependent dioxygenase AlkB [Massilia agrisoli]MCC6070233.1 alpha-ketoglutarate-dependent dioxygenase AlkB [Massilia agrisoli]
MDLFPSSNTLIPIPIPDGELLWLAQLPLGLANEEVLARLVAQTSWRAESITLWGKQHLQPRLTAWYGDARYSYSGLDLEPLPFTPLLLEIKRAVETVTGEAFNSVLLNYYRDGRDSMGMHSDDEAELGPEPAIASLSLGATRTFILRHRQSKQTVKLDLTSGSVLLMRGKTQHFWLHGINKSARQTGPRVNLTFRKICASADKLQQKTK